MRVLISCFAIVCLSLANGAPSEIIKTHLWTHSSGDRDVLHSPWPFWENQIVYTACREDGATNNCYVFRDNLTHVRSCHLELKKGDLYRRHFLFNAGNSRAVVVERENENTIKLINAKLKDRSGDFTETTVDVPRQPGEHRAWWYFTSIFVVPRGEKNYDLFFRNEKLCPGFLCRATYDFDGKLVKAASAYPVKVAGNEDLYRVVAADNGDLVAHSVDKVTNVYLVKDGENQVITTLFNGTYDRPYVSLSTEESKLGSCLYLDDNVVCKQFDGEGKTKLIDISIPVDPERGYPLVDMYNLKRGFLLMTVEFRPTLNDPNSKAVVSVSRIDDQGKLGKSVYYDSHCANGNLIFGKLFRNTDGKICVTAICRPPYDGKIHSAFSRIVECFFEDE